MTVGKMESKGAWVIMHGQKYGPGRPVVLAMSFHAVDTSALVNVLHNGDYVVVSMKHEGANADAFLTPAQATELRDKLTEALDAAEPSTEGETLKRTGGVTSEPVTVQ